MMMGRHLRTQLYRHHVTMYVYIYTWSHVYTKWGPDYWATWVRPQGVPCYNHSYWVLDTESEYSKQRSLVAHCHVVYAVCSLNEHMVNGLPRPTVAVIVLFLYFLSMQCEFGHLSQSFPAANLFHFPQYGMYVCTPQSLYSIQFFPLYFIFVSDNHRILASHQHHEESTSLDLSLAQGIGGGTGGAGGALAPPKNLWWGALPPHPL